MLTECTTRMFNMSKIFKPYLSQNDVKFLDLTVATSLGMILKISDHGPVILQVLKVPLHHAHLLSKWCTVDDVVAHSCLTDFTFQTQFNTVFHSILDIHSTLWLILNGNICYLNNFDITWELILIQLVLGPPPYDLSFWWDVIHT